ncbi:SGNH/GDSL hydrolase family protein [Marinobacterium jannaschii]|uniref:SGNH/GDSL hydrolase family protein n=1 Tax=Marinobacterium jannaschii TaxID=64970 RepID=UPI00048187EE|nr:SGNH/GDSL hydrolase family protein [Marinobacterium jannaschii]
MKTFRPNILRWHELENSDLPIYEDPLIHDQLILAEGDSWFTLGGAPVSNLLFPMRFTRLTMIVDCASPGDTMRNMADMTHNQSLKNALDSEDYRWDLILLSGGGNDMIDHARQLLLPAAQRTSSPLIPSDYCDLEKLDALIEEILSGYRTIASRRDSGPATGTPILTHTYDYATPRNSPARFFNLPMPTLGPWLYPALIAAEVPQDQWIAVVGFLFDNLADGILSLALGPDPISNFHVIDTRETLTPAELGTAGESGDWMNEIHPDAEGYQKLAAQLDEKVIDLLS